MEAAIRGALDRAGNPDATMRARIYQSARQALSRSLERQGLTDPELMRDQSARLEQLIAHVEAEWTNPQVRQPQPAAPAIDPPRTTLPPAAPVVEPAVTAERRDPVLSSERPAPVASGERRDPGFGDQPSGQPAFTPAAPGADDGLTIEPHRTEPPAAPAPAQAGAVKPGAARSKSRPKRGGLHLVSRLFSAAVIMSFFVMGIWWVIASGAFQSAEQRDTSVPNPPPTVNEDDFDAAAPRQLNPGAGFTGEWKTAFSPTQQDGEIVTSARAQAEFAGAGENRVLRIVSTAGDSAGEVRIPIDAAVLGDAARQQSIVALTVKAVGNEPTQIYVRCDFPGLGDCGRRRFDVGTAVSDVLFDLKFDGAATPSGDGAIIINSDITGAGHGIDIHAVRIRPAS